MLVVQRVLVVVYKPVARLTHSRALCFRVTLVVFSSQLCVQLAAARIGVVVVSVDPAVAIGAIPYVACGPVPKRAAPYEAFLFAHAAQIHP